MLFLDISKTFNLRSLPISYFSDNSLFKFKLHPSNTGVCLEGICVFVKSF